MCVFVVPYCSQRQGAPGAGVLLPESGWLWADAEFFSPRPGFASCPARRWHNVTVACSETAGADALPLQSIPAPPRRGTKLTLPPWPRCFWVVRREKGLSTHALPIPASRRFPRASAGSAPRGESQAWEGKSQHDPGDDDTQGWGSCAQHPPPAPHAVPQPSHWGLTPQSPP